MHGELVGLGPELERQLHRRDGFDLVYLECSHGE